MDAMQQKHLAKKKKKTKQEKDEDEAAWNMYVFGFGT